MNFIVQVVSIHGNQISVDGNGPVFDPAKFAYALSYGTPDERQHKWVGLAIRPDVA